MARCALAVKYGGQPEDFEDGPSGALEEMLEVAHFEQRLGTLGKWEGPPPLPAE